MVRYLNVTANTTFAHLPARATGDGWGADTVAIVDVESPGQESPGDEIPGDESPGDDPTVRVGLELDADVAGLPHHAVFLALSPAEARTFAGDLERVATAAENGETTTSGRR